jgi:glutaredoxin-related protein
VKRKHKQYFFYYVKENILIFDVFDYIEELGADYVDYCFEWGLIKNNFVLNKSSFVKHFLFYVNNDSFFPVISEKEKKYKILCFYKEKQQLNEWSKFYESPEKFVNFVKRSLKKNLNNFFEIKDDISLFQNIKGDYQGIPCLLPSGEDEDFLLKINKKLK